MSEASQEYLEALVSVIKEGQEKAFADLISEWQFVNMNAEEEAIVAPKLVRAMADYERSELLAIMSDVLGSTRCGYTYIQELFTYVLDNVSLAFLLEEYRPEEETEYFELVRGLIEYLSGVDDLEVSRIAVVNLRNAFPDPREIYTDTVEKLIIIGRDLADDVVNKYLDETLHKTLNPSAPRPIWMLHNDKTHDELVRELLDSLDEARPENWVSEGLESDIEYLCSIVEEDKDLDKLREDLRNTLSIKTVEEREELITQIVWNNTLMRFGDRADMFRVFGLCLPIWGGVDLKLRSKDPCEMWGGCRSMLCWHNENYDEDTGDLRFYDPVGQGKLDDLWWFTGSCQVCALKIEKECYALRMPLETGGFLGCFCSFDCIRTRVRSQPHSDIVEENYEGTKIVEQENPNRMYMVEEMEKKYMEFGIWDR